MDKKYWESVYQKKNIDSEQSLFAKFVGENLSNNHKSLIELGCGNGRDAIYFANKNLNIIAVDQCENEIRFLKELYSKVENLEFIYYDFCELGFERSYDIVYSRFTLHSISEIQESKVLLWAYQVLNDNGMLCIEVRGKKNELYRKGKPVENEKDAFIWNEHYRRFIAFNKFCERLEDIGFSLEYAEEKKGFAPYKHDDETFIRVIAKKM